MARLDIPRRPDEGHLSFYQTGPDSVRVTYKPSEPRIGVYNEGWGRGFRPECVLLDVHAGYDCLTMYPIITLPNSRFMQEKYYRILSISVVGLGIQTPTDEREVQELLENLPEGFVKDFDYGLGLRKRYRFIIDALGEVPGVRSLVIAHDEETEALGAVFQMSAWDFDAVVAGIERISNKYQRNGQVEKSIFAYNAMLHNLDPRRHPERTRPYKPDTIYRYIAKGAAHAAKLSHKDRVAVVQAVADNVQRIATEDTQSLMELRNEIEIVTLGELISRFESMLRRNLSESKWQTFLQENPFILGLTLSVPVLCMGGGVSVGGRALSGGGEKFADFLVKNALTNNAALVEIKTPQSRLFGKEYRPGVFAPSAELVGAVSQVLDQKQKFERQFLVMLHNSRNLELEPHSIRCILIVGTTPDQTAGKGILSFIGIIRGLWIF